DGRNPAPRPHWIVDDLGMFTPVVSFPTITADDGALSIRHHGFARIPGVGEHTRTVRVDRDGNLQIADIVEGRGEHLVTLVFHLTNAVQSAQGTTFRISSVTGTFTLPADLSPLQIWSAPESTELHGWGTPRYGDRVPLTTVVVEAK